MIEMETRHCQECEMDLPLSSFAQSVDKRDGKTYHHSVYCLVCYRKVYRRENREKILAYQKRYYQENRERIRKKQSQRHKKNYVPKKKKTSMEKERDKFLKWAESNNVSFNE